MKQKTRRRAGVGLGIPDSGRSAFIRATLAARIDLFEKRFNYARLSGLKEYLVINPDRRRVEVFRYPGATHELYLHGRFYLACLDMELEVESLFADLSEIP